MRRFHDRLIFIVEIAVHVKTLVPLGSAVSRHCVGNTTCESNISMAPALEGLNSILVLTYLYRIMDLTYINTKQYVIKNFCWYRIRMPKQILEPFVLARAQCIRESLNMDDGVIDIPRHHIDNVLTTIKRFCCNWISVCVIADYFCFSHSVLFNNTIEYWGSSYYYHLIWLCCMNETWGSVSVH